MNLKINWISNLSADFESDRFRHSKLLELDFESSTIGFRSPNHLSLHKWSSDMDICIKEATEAYQQKKRLSSYINKREDKSCLTASNRCCVFPSGHP